MILALIGFISAQSPIKFRSQDETFCGESSRGCIEINVSYNEEGEILRWSVRPNRDVVDVFTSPGIPFDNVMKLFEEYFPAEKRGELIRTTQFSLGRAFGEGRTFEKVLLTTTVTCRQNKVCGVSYAEVRKRNSANDTDSRLDRRGAATR